MSNCPKCFDTPCRCGWEWARGTPKSLRRMAVTLTRLARLKENHPSDTREQIYSRLMRWDCGGR